MNKSLILNPKSLILKCIYPSAITRIPVSQSADSSIWQTTEKNIFLTFDDGPIPEVTPNVLSILKEYKAKATFFCTGENIEKHPDIFRQIISHGHSVGNHTYNHLNGWKTKTKEYLENVEQCKTAMDNGHQPSTINHQPFFRPPYGRMKLSQYSTLSTQYSLIMWDVLSGDFAQHISKERCLNRVLKKTRAGSIVVFHDSIKAKEKLLYVLPEVLKYFTKKEFSFNSLAG